MSVLYFWGKPLTKQFNLHTQTTIKLMNLPETIQSVSAGQQHSIILTKNGVYGVGSNLEGQLGYELPLISGIGLVKLEIGEQVKIISVSCGWHHTLLLDQNGNVYSSGKGDNGELGRGRVRCGSTFSVVLSKARQISAGKDHSLALCGSKVYGWGNSNEGQLGLLITKNYFTPQELNVYPCQLMFAGTKYSIFVTSKGIYATGANNHCQLGLGHQNSVQVPRKIALQQKIVKIVGNSYCCACNSQNEWYMWGNGAMGLFRYPTKMSFLKGSKYVQLGINFGVYEKQNKIFAWGENRWGELCTNQEFKQYPSEIEHLSELALQNISCGSNFIIGYINKQKQVEKTQKSQQMNASIQIQKEYRLLDKQNRQLFEQFRSNCISQAQKNSQHLFKQYYKSKKSDSIIQVQRKSYSQEDSIHQKQRKKGSFATHSEKLSQIINQPQDIKNKTFFEQKTKQRTKMSLFLEKQNQGLKERLQFERFQRLRLKDHFSKNMNKFQQDKINQKMQNFQRLIGSRKRSQKSKQGKKIQEIRNPQSPKELAEISFRAQQSGKQRIDQLGNKINQLSRFLHQTMI